MRLTVNESALRELRLLDEFLTIKNSVNAMIDLEHIKLDLELEKQ